MSIVEKIKYVRYGKDVVVETISELEQRMVDCFITINDKVKLPTDYMVYYFHRYNIVLKPKNMKLTNPIVVKITMDMNLIENKDDFFAYRVIEDEGNDERFKKYKKYDNPEWYNFQVSLTIEKCDIVHVGKKPSLPYHDTPDKVLLEEDCSFITYDKLYLSYNENSYFYEIKDVIVMNKERFICYKKKNLWKDTIMVWKED